MMYDIAITITTMFQRFNVINLSDESETRAHELPFFFF